MKPAALYDRLIAPRTSLAAALLLIIPFLLTRDPLARTLSLIPLLLPAVLSGRPGRIIPMVITFAAVTLLGLFPAAGQELLRWRFIVIGSESFLRGIGRASIFCGMMLLSRMAIRPGLAGRGSFLGGILVTFEWFDNRLGEFRAGDPAGTLDRLLLDCDAGMADMEPDKETGKIHRVTTPAGWLVLVLIVLLTAGMLAAPRIYRLIG